jgi:hypothetical protein
LRIPEHHQGIIVFRTVRNNRKKQITPESEKPKNEF